MNSAFSSGADLERVMYPKVPTTHEMTICRRTPRGLPDSSKIRVSAVTHRVRGRYRQGQMWGWMVAFRHASGSVLTQRQGPRSSRQIARQADYYASFPIALRSHCPIGVSRFAFAFAGRRGCVAGPKPHRPTAPGLGEASLPSCAASSHPHPPPVNQ